MNASAMDLEELPALARKTKKENEERERRALKEQEKPKEIQEGGVASSKTAKGPSSEKTKEGEIQISQEASTSTSSASSPSISKTMTTPKSALFPEWTDWADCVTSYNNLVETTNTIGNSNHTNIETTFTKCIEVASYVRRYFDCNNSPAKSAIVSEYVTKTMRELAPRLIGLWLLDTGIWDESEKFFKSDQAARMLNLARNSTHKRDAKEEELKIYGATCGLYREALKNKLADANIIFGIDDEDVNLTVGVHQSFLSRLNMMLTNISAKRAQSLGESVGNQRRLPHYDHFLDDGVNLLGTASPIGNYRQQMSNMDIIFNFFMWMQIIGAKKSDRLGINASLYFLGDKILGSRKVESAMKGTTTKIADLVPFLNKQSSMYIPPYAITCRRMYDFVAVYGILKVNMLAESFIKPGVSTRYITHYKLESGLAMRFVISYWTIESLDDKQGVLESENMFYQLLTGKKSAYENSSRKARNVLGIKFVGLRQ